uniref:Uncharacterized protein n=1 Tax=Avena sativa TaxID=4498 RepID=A0ACD6AKH6_AVESA
MFEAQTISNILDQFCQNSCQTPNWSKSGILFTKNVPLSDRENIKRIFPCPNIDSSFVHLGHPLILPSKDRSAAYAFIYDKFKSKLSNYKANRLSHAARLTLMKSLTTIIRNFWWTGVQEDQITKSICLRAWADICTDKKSGGLGIRNLQAINQGLILSAAWRLAKDPHSQLAQILKAKYHHDTSIWRAKYNIPKSSFWTSVLKVQPLLISATAYQIVDGDNSLWSIPWIQDWETIYDNLIIQQQTFNYPAQIKDLWISGQKVGIVHTNIVSIISNFLQERDQRQFLHIL